MVCLCVHVRVCACTRACVRACVGAWVRNSCCSQNLACWFPIKFLLRVWATYDEIQDPEKHGFGLQVPYTVKGLGLGLTKEQSFQVYPSTLKTLTL